ncbi:MAG: MgtC/SapB family protein [Brevundimonas sp.]|nr:MAG: MgtC/SapB family protein [Brevundimonas sp.]
MIDLVWPILGSLTAGGVIGFEREWRGRAAGLRTHILVSLASCLLMLAAMSQADWAFQALPDENIVTDPTRMAHGVLTGIGFLCAGVIFRTGFSVHGLTTAASLWITAAIGLLFGAGLYGLGIVGTLVTALILIGLRLVNERLPQTPIADLTVTWRREVAVAEALSALLARRDAGFKADCQELMADGALWRRSYRMRLKAGEVEALAHDIAALPGVTGLVLDPRGD